MPILICAFLDIFVISTFKFRYASTQNQDVAIVSMPQADAGSDRISLFCMALFLLFLYVTRPAKE
jgi:hypothetical protein